MKLGSYPIDKASEETADKEKAADAARGAMHCSLVAAMVTAGAAKAVAVKETAVAAEKAAAATAEEAAVESEDQIKRDVGDESSEAGSQEDSKGG